MAGSPDVPTPPPAFGRTLPVEGREGARPDKGANRQHPLNSTTSFAKSQAKVLRKNLTDAEAKLWVHLRRIRTIDTHFRKQVPIGRYIADFACMRSRVIVELDGEQHGFDAALTYDASRTHFLESRGFTVLRFANGEVLWEMSSVLDTIYAALHGAVDAAPRSASKRKGAGVDAPSSPSTGEVASEASRRGRSTYPGPSGHSSHRGEGEPAAKTAPRPEGDR